MRANKLSVLIWSVKTCCIGLVISLFFVFAMEPNRIFAAEEMNLPKMETGKVMLSWPELKLLLDELESLKRFKAEQEEDKQKKQDVPPADYAIAEADYQGTINGESARFESKFSVWVLKDGWVTIPFFSKDIGIEQAQLHTVDQNPGESKEPDAWEKETASSEDNTNNKQTAQLIRDENGCSLIAKGPGLYRIESVFHIPVKMENLIHALSFQPPRAVVNRVRVQFPEKGLRIINASPQGRIVQADHLVDNQAAFETVLSDNEILKLNWRIEKDAGIVRKSQAVIHALASVTKSSVSVSCTVQLNHINSLKSILFHLPLDVEIINVAGSDIVKWHVETTDKEQVIKFEGDIDRRIGAEISLAYLARLPELPVKTIMPVVSVVGADHVDGYLGVEIVGNLEAAAEGADKGITIPPKNLPADLWKNASNPLMFGYEFHAKDFAPVLAVKSYLEIRTVVANVDMVDCVTHRTLSGKSVTRIRYFIRNNDRQFLTLMLPEDSRIWQAFLDGEPVKPARKETGEILIPMKKSAEQEKELRSFVIEIGFITEVGKLSLKGDIMNRLPAIDIPVSYLRWSLFLPEYYEYTRFEGPLKQVSQFTNTNQDSRFQKPLIDIPTQGQQFFFEKFLVVDEGLYVKGKYGQYLGDDIFLSLQPDPAIPQQMYEKSSDSEMWRQQQVVPNSY